MTHRRKKLRKSDRSERERAKLRVEHWLDVFYKGLDGYEAENPNWRFQSLLCILDSCFDSLRACVESSRSKDITWETPVAEVHFPVEWNWNRRRGRDNPEPQITYGTITSDETKRKSTAIKAVSRLMAATLIQHVLKDLTNEVILEKRGERYTPMFSSETAEMLRKVRGKAARQSALESLYQPFCMGMEEVEIDDSGQVVSGRSDNFVPAIQLDGNWEGHEFTINLLFIARPMIVDVRRRVAYYPLSVGFSIHPKTPVVGMEWMKERWANPASWSRSDRNAFWDGIRAALKKLREELRPKRANEVQSALLSLKLKLEVPIDQSDPDAANRVIEKMLNQFRETGKISELSTAWSPAPNTSSVEQLLALVHAVEGARSAAEKGRTLESLLKALLATVPGFEVQSNTRTETEEIDVVVVNSSDDTRWRKSPLILFECKNWAIASGKNELVQFKAKAENRRGQCSVAFLVSWNGFADTAVAELQRSSTKQLVLGMISGDDLRHAAKNGSFLPTLQAAWTRSVMH